MHFSLKLFSNFWPKQKTDTKNGPRWKLLLKRQEKKPLCYTYIYRPHFTDLYKKILHPNKTFYWNNLKQWKPFCVWLWFWQFFPFRMHASLRKPLDAPTRSTWFPSMMEKFLIWLLQPLAAKPLVSMPSWTNCSAPPGATLRPAPPLAVWYSTATALWAFTRIPVSFPACSHKPWWTQTSLIGSRRNWAMDSVK